MPRVAQATMSVVLTGKENGSSSGNDVIVLCNVAQKSCQSRLLVADHRLNLSHDKYYLQNHLLKLQKPF